MLVMAAAPLFRLIQHTRGDKAIDRIVVHVVHGGLGAEHGLQNDSHFDFLRRQMIGPASQWRRFLQCRGWGVRRGGAG